MHQKVIEYRHCQEIPHKTNPTNQVTRTFLMRSTNCKIRAQPTGVSKQTKTTFFLEKVSEGYTKIFHMVEDLYLREKRRAALHRHQCIRNSCFFRLFISRENGFLLKRSNWWKKSRRQGRFSRGCGNGDAE